jgi:hypothetical protein
MTTLDSSCLSKLLHANNYRPENNGYSLYEINVVLDFEIASSFIRYDLNVLLRETLAGRSQPRFKNNITLALAK